MKVAVPASCYATLVERHAISTMRSGNIASAVSTLNKDLDMAYGICLLRESPALMETVSEEVTVRLLEEALSAEADTNFDLPHLVKDLRNVAQGQSLLAALNDCLVLVSPDGHEEEAINSSAAAFSLNGGTHSDKFCQLLASHAGRELVARARQSSMQRVVDRGPSHVLCISTYHLLAHTIRLVSRGRSRLHGAAAGMI